MSDVELKHGDEFYNKFTSAGKTFHIAARGDGKSIKSLYKAYEETIRLQILEIMKKESDLERIILDSLEEEFGESYERLSVDDREYISDISSLKKQIKHCKNPMEKKRLEQELNRAYKERKKK